MKISDSRRLRGEKKSLRRQAHQDRQNSRFDSKFYNVAKAIAEGGDAAAKLDFNEVNKIVKAAGKTGEDLQKLVEEIRNGDA